MTKKRTKEEIQSEIDRLQRELRKSEMQEEMVVLTQELQKQENEIPPYLPQESSKEKIGKSQRERLVWRKTTFMYIGGFFVWIYFLWILVAIIDLLLEQKEWGNIEQKEESVWNKTLKINNIQLTNTQKAEVIDKMIKENTSGFLACRTIDLNYNKKDPSYSQWKSFSESWGISVDQAKYLAEQCAVAAEKTPPNYDFLLKLLKDLWGKPTWFPWWMYKVWKDIPAGEYVIIGSGYLEISTDSTGSFESIIENDNYKNRTIILVKHGEYVRFKWHAYTWDEAPLLQNPKIILEWKYKVGKDFPAGEYKIFPLAWSGYYEINPTAREDIIVTNDNFDHEIYLTLKSGQYLKLSGAELLLK